MSLSGDVIGEMQEKLALFSNEKNLTIKKILITTFGVTKNLKGREYFDRIQYFILM